MILVSLRFLHQDTCTEIRIGPRASEGCQVSSHTHLPLAREKNRANNYGATSTVSVCTSDGNGGFHVLERNAENEGAEEQGDFPRALSEPAAGLRTDSPDRTPASNAFTTLLPCRESCGGTN